MDEYVGIYDNGNLSPCVKMKAKNIDDAKDKFILYLKNNKNINCINMSKLYLINYSYLGKIQ